MKILEGNKYYLFFDLDETLMFNSVISQENIDALAKAQENGHEIFLITGRTLGGLPKEVEKIKFDGYLLGASYIKYKDEELFKSYLDKDIISNGISLLRNSSYGAAFEGEKKCLNISNEERANMSEKEFERIISSFDFEEAKISKITFHYRLKEDEIKKLEDKMAIVSFPHKTECVLKGQDKGFLIKKFGATVKVTKDNFIVFGDSENDVSMFNTVKNNVAICPSSKKIRNMAQLIIFKPENGVEIALKTLNLI